MDTSKYLKAEIERLQKAATINYVVSAVLSLIVVGYAVCGLWMLGLFTNPAQLSDSLIYKARKDGPVAIANLERNLELKAPEVANTISFSLQKMIPQIRYSLQSDMDAALTQNYAAMQKGLVSLTSAWLEAHADEIGTKAPSESVETYANRVVSALTANFGDNLDIYMTETLGMSVDDLASRSEYILGKLDTHLEELSKVSGKNMTRSQQLERFLIGYVINTYLSHLPATN